MNRLTAYHLTRAAQARRLLAVAINAGSMWDTYALAYNEHAEAISAARALNAWKYV